MHYNGICIMLLIEQLLGIWKCSTVGGTQQNRGYSGTIELLLLFTN
jgi:hypothetical protein